MSIIRKRTYARAGLIGNPSDGYGGKTIALSVKNFSAEVVLYESPQLEIRPSIHDRLVYRGVEDLITDVRHAGYYGGIRLIKAAIGKFVDHARDKGCTLHGRNFTVTYDTDIPKQVGLAGSSAIITSVFKALMDFYRVDIDQPILPNIVLSVETEELKLAAGLQDRVIQTYGGLVYMDFAPSIMERQGYGLYESMDTSLLPDLILVYVEKPSESDKFHSDVRFRFQNRDKEVLDAMKRFARLTDQAKASLEKGDIERLGKLMNENFDLRRRIYGDRVIGSDNLRMIELVRAEGAPAKFTGSGGAIIGVVENRAQFQSISRRARAEGFKVVKIKT